MTARLPQNLSVISAQATTVDSINPATGAKLESFALHTQAELEAILDRAVAAQRAWAARTLRRARGFNEDRRRLLAGQQSALRPQRDPRNGQADRRRRGRGREVRVGLRLLRRQRRAVLGRRAHRVDRHRELHRLPAAGGRAGGHALELPVLASLPFRGSGAHGRQRRACSSMPATSPAARSISRKSSAKPASRPACSRRSSCPGPRSSTSSPTTASPR